MPIATSILDVVEAIKKQITDKAMGMSGTASPQAQEPPQQLTPEPPPDVDYTAGMQRPELTKLASNMEFKATPSRATAMLVALGNILQDKRNVEAAKQGAEQKEYDVKLGNAIDLNKARTGMSMKREFDESDPDTQLRRELLQTELAQKKEMFPLEKQYKQTALDRLLMKGTMGGGSSRGGSGNISSSMEPNFANLTDEETAAATGWDTTQMKVFKAAPNKEKIRMFKPYMNNRTAEKLYSGGARWTTNEAGEKVFEPGEKPLTPSQVEAAIKIKQRQKSNILASELPEEEASAAMAVKDAEIAELEDALVDTIKSKLPKAQPQQPKEGSTAEKIVNGKKTTFIRQNGKWVSQ